jgi:hypothetical protein
MAREAADGALIVNYADRYPHGSETANNSESLIVAANDNGAYRRCRATGFERLAC